MTTMDDLAAFITARLDEDEAMAKLAAREGGTWTQDDPERRPGAISSAGGQVVYDEGAPDEYQAAHIARHDPARVLREVAAKRAMVADHGPSEVAPDACRRCKGGMAFPCRTIRHLAAAWSDHPDYRAGWATA